MRVPGLLLLFATLSGCGPRVTSVRLDLARQDGVSAMADWLKVSLFGVQHRVLDDQKIEPARLPGDLVVLLPEDAGEARVLVHARVDGTHWRAVASELLRARGEVRLQLRLATVELDDHDGDGVPDDIDNCPSDENDDQEDDDRDGHGDTCSPRRSSTSRP